MKDTITDKSHLGIQGPPDTESLVIEEIRERQKLGIQKYGMTVAENQAGLKEWLKHAYEEALDLAIYLRRNMQELEATTKRPSSVAYIRFVLFWTRMKLKIRHMLWRGRVCPGTGKRCKCLWCNSGFDENCYVTHAQSKENV